MKGMIAPERTFLRFLLVGAALALVYALLAAIATSQLPVPKAVAAAGAWLLCIPLGFWAHRRITFATRKAHHHGLWLYAATQILGICIASTVSFLFASGAFRQDIFVHLLASGLAAIASYVINRIVVFPHSAAD